MPILNKKIGLAGILCLRPMRPGPGFHLCELTMSLGSEAAYPALVKAGEVLLAAGCIEKAVAKQEGCQGGLLKFQNLCSAPFFP